MKLQPRLPQKFLSIAFLIATLFSPIRLFDSPRAIATSTYNPAQAVNWALANNPNDSQYRGQSQGHYCTTYVARALAYGGLNTSMDWVGNQQIVRWLLDNPNVWEERPLSQLVAGDFVLYSPYDFAPANWTYIDAVGGWSYWWHVALVISPGYVAAWNADQVNVPITAYTSLPYQKGIHIRETSSIYQGILPLGYSQRQTRATDGPEHTWTVYLDGRYPPALIDVKPVIGFQHRLVLTNSSGQVVAETRSSSNGRSILTLDSFGSDNYTIKLIPDVGAVGTYEIAGYLSSIPRLRSNWDWQYAYSIIRRWEAMLDFSTRYQVVWERISGDLEITYELRDRASGALITSGSSSLGRAAAVGNGEAGFDDFYITSVSGDGSYRISLRLLPDADTIMPTGYITSPTAGSVLASPYVHVEATASDTGGTVKRVRLYIYHDGDWEFIGDDTQPPYAWDWYPGCGVSSQTIKMGVHIEDAAGNYNMTNNEINPISLIYNHPAGCDEISDGIHLLSFQNDWAKTGDHVIAMIDLNSPGIRVETAQELSDPVSAKFKTHSIEDLVKHFSGVGEYNHPFIAINGVGYNYLGLDIFNKIFFFSPRDSTVGPSIFAINGMPYCSSGPNCLGTYPASVPGGRLSPSFMTIKGTENVQGRVFRSEVDFNPNILTDPQDDQALKQILADNSNPGFAVGYFIQPLLDMQYGQRPGEINPSFPQYTLSPTSQSDLTGNSITLLGVSSDGKHLYMGVSDSAILPEDLARKLMDLGASRVIVLDSGSSSQFALFGEKTSGVNQWSDTNLLGMPKTVLNGIVAYNTAEDTSHFQQMSSVGGSVQLVDQTTFTFPPDAFTETVNLRFSPRSTSNLVQSTTTANEKNATPQLVEVGISWEVSAALPDGQFTLPGEPYQVEIPYLQSNVPANINEGDLGLYWWNGYMWVRQNSYADTAANIVHATVTQTGQFALLAPPISRIFVPAIQR